jgi:hypothetical protein
MPLPHHEPDHKSSHQCEAEGDPEKYARTKRSANWVRDATRA